MLEDGETYEPEMMIDQHFGFSQPKISGSQGQEVESKLILPSGRNGSSVNVGSLDSGEVPMIEFEDPSFVRMKQRMRRS